MYDTGPEASEWVPFTRERRHDAGHAVYRADHGVFHRLHKAVDHRARPVGAGSAVDAAARHEAIGLDAHEPQFLLFIARQRRCDALMHIAMRGFTLEGVFRLKDVLRQRLRLHRRHHVTDVVFHRNSPKS
jgi:hypothetical protein